MNLADAISRAHDANERKLTAEIRIPVQFDADAAVLFEPFARFCSVHGVLTCPANPKVLAAFVRSEAKLGVDPAKIAATLDSVALLHDRHGLANPAATAVCRAELERVLGTEAPRSWKKAEQLMFAILPPEIRAVITRRDREREREMRRCQNEVAELKRQAEKPATTSEKEKVENQ